MRLPTGGVTTIQENMPPTDSLAVVGEQEDLQRRGRPYVLVRHGQWVGGVQLGVFEDPNSALKIFEGHLSHTSVVLTKTRVMKRVKKSTWSETCPFAWLAGARKEKVRLHVTWFTQVKGLLWYQRKWPLALDYRGDQRRETKGVAS
jgi:hypothetical protein